MDDAHQQRVTAAAELEAKLETERDRRNITWRQVAQILDMTTQNLSRIRKGEISVSREAGKAIAKFLDGQIALEPLASGDSAGHERSPADAPWIPMLTDTRTIAMSGSEFGMHYIKMVREYGEEAADDWAVKALIVRRDARRAARGTVAVDGS